MSGLGRAVEALRGPGAAKPPRTLVLPPSVFASEWTSRPREPVVVGLRLLADGEEQTARAEAVRCASELHPEAFTEEWLEAYNDALLRWIVARGICDPNDLTQPSQVLPMAEDQVRSALTSLGVRFIFDAIERLQVETSPLYSEASSEEIEELRHRLANAELGSLTPTAAGRARRLLRYVLLELRAANPVET